MYDMCIVEFFIIWGIVINVIDWVVGFVLMYECLFGYNVMGDNLNIMCWIDGFWFKVNLICDSE